MTRVDRGKIFDQNESCSPSVEDILSNTYSETPVDRMMTRTVEDLLRYTSAHSISTA